MAALLALPAGALAAPRDVRLVSAGPGLVRFTVAVPEARIARVARHEGLDQIAIEGYGSDGRPGAPALPVRVVDVAVPPAGEVSLRASAAGGETREGVLLAPPPQVTRGHEDDPPRYERSAEAYAASAGVAPQRARLLGVTWLRNQRVATVAILPADYEPAARRVTLYHEVDVELSFAPAASPGPAAEPRDPFEEVYREALVNYEQGRAWRRARSAARGAAGRVAPARAGALAVPSVSDTSIFAGRGWIKIAVTKTGFYQVNFGQLRQLPLFAGLPNGPESARIESLRLFTWPGYPVLPENNYCDACDYREVAIRVEETETPDGLFNHNAETITFYALGPSDWADTYEPSQPESVFVNHPYETRSYYYLTVATAESPVAGTPARIDSTSGAVQRVGAPAPDFPARVHAEQDVEYFPDLYPGSQSVFWEKWFWRSMSLGNLFSLPVETPGVDSTQTATIRVRQWGIEIFPGSSDHLLEILVNGQPVPREGWFGNTAFSYDADIPIQALRSLDPNTVTVSIPVAAPRTTDRSALGWIEVRYRRRFVPVGDELAFDTPPGGGDSLYSIGPFTSSQRPRVFDVTDAYAPFEVHSVSYSALGGKYQLGFETPAATRTGLRRYRIVPSNGIVKVADASVSEAAATSLQNLRSTLGGADYVLIYYDGFKAGADSLAAWRTSHLPLDGPGPPYTVLSIPVSAVYDQFSGGRTDPTAIRNLLRAAFYNWRTIPAFVTLLGDASYDFKNIKGLAPAGLPGSLVPTYENAYYPPKQFTSDDWLFNVDDPAVNIPDFYGGRIPAVDAGTALDFVLKKTLFYERQAPLGEWRDKVLLIADDQEQGSRDDNIHWGHLSQTTRLDSTFTPPHMDRDYVYLHTYPDGPGDTKPGAKADIKQAVNDGVLLFNYIGHGSPFKLADETVLSDVDAGTFTNATRPTLFVAASCDIGRFSDPTVQSLGERLLLAPSGGAVAVISATELAYSDLNVDLNWEIYRQLFNRLAASGQYHESISQALLIAKRLTSSGYFAITNNSKYPMMGDAATRLQLPRYWVDLSLHACDTCSTVIHEVKRGQTLTFRGTVLDRPGGSLVPLDGLADLLIEDSAPRDSAPPCPLYDYTFCRSPLDPDGCQPSCLDCDTVACYRPNYWFRAGPMFRGDVKVEGGFLSGKFVVPIEARGGARGRVRAYVDGQAAGADGVGSIYTQVSPGSPVVGDNEGPRITLSFASGSNIVRPDAVLRVDLYDPSGILITGHTLQNGIVVTLDGNTTSRVDITPSFRYLTGSYTTGTASWTLPNPPPGPHTIRVSAADNLAAGLTASSHRSSTTIAIEVAETPPVKIVNAYLFPNPTHSGGPGSGGQFVVDALGDRVNALLRIYTVSGRLVRTLELFDRQGQIQIPWDGLDDELQALANGTYLFRVQLNLRDEGGKSSPLQTASTQGRFVILNH
ncbi:MAG TPA: C25 family cysteine peptidase [Candidatus Eisenbacteria bacterium]